MYQFNGKSLIYGAYRDYDPSAKTPETEKRQAFVFGVKDDKFLHGRSFIDSVVEQLAEDPELPTDFFGPNRVLIPVPRCAPLKSNSLWPTRRITEQMQKHRLGQSFPIVKRVLAVQSSRMAKAGERPSPDVHLNSLNIDDVRIPCDGITLVDDVVTRGSTFLGVLPLVEEQFPGVDIKAFAIFVTRRDCGITKNPYVGVINYQNGRPSRNP